MSPVLLLSTICLLARASHSYILLTANLEDLQSLAKQVMNSPIGARIGKIWMRAYDQFNQAITDNKHRANRRFTDDEPADDDDDSPKDFTRGPEDRRSSPDDKERQ